MIDKAAFEAAFAKWMRGEELNELEALEVMEGSRWETPKEVFARAKATRGDT